MDSDDYGEQHNSNSHSHTHNKASPTSLFSSAKVVAEAAPSTFRHDGHGYDKAKVADAAADLLGAASRYGKLEGSGYGTYIEKAENYLHQYNRPTAHQSEDGGGGGHSKPNSTRHDSEEEEEGGGYMKMAQGFMGHKGANNTSHGKEDGGGGMGDYMKMAQGFMAHSSGNSGRREEEEESGGGYGEYVKMAEGFMKKH